MQLPSDYTLCLNKDSFKDLQNSSNKGFKLDEIQTEFSFVCSNVDIFGKIKMDILEQSIPHIQELQKVEPPLNKTLIRVLACFGEYPTYPVPYL